MKTREFHRLRVAETRKEIDGEATSVCFDVPDALADVFRWRPGQHLTLRVSIDESELRRSYTISTSPFAGDPLRITVKRVAQGQVSNYVNDRVEAGMELDIMPPCGSFCLDPGPKLRRTHYFLGAGSGITPLYSMIHAVLKEEPHSVAHLLYGNRNDQTILLRHELDTLLQTHPNRLSICHVLSAPNLMTWFTPWASGRINGDKVQRFIAEHPPYAQDTQYYLCAPGDMNRSMNRFLQEIDVPESRIHAESFGGEGIQDLSVRGIAATAMIHLGGERKLVAVAAEETLLEAARRAGLRPPFSCQSGVCGTCRAELKEGEVHHRSRAALKKAEIDKGAVLTCQAVAKTDCLKIAYDG